MKQQYESNGAIIRKIMMPIWRTFVTKLLKTFYHIKEETTLPCFLLKYQKIVNIRTKDLPGYNNSITSVTQPDGSIKLTTVEQAYSNIGVSLNQKIAATGGAFTASSNINRFDMLTGNRNRTFSICL